MADWLAALMAEKMGRNSEFRSDRQLEMYPAGEMVAMMEYLLADMKVASMVAAMVVGLVALKVR